MLQPFPGLWLLPWVRRHLKLHPLVLFYPQQAVLMVAPHPLALGVVTEEAVLVLAVN
jgi:hypothetical protein